MFVLYLNAFLMVIPNIVTKFQNVDIFEHFVTFFIVVCSRMEMVNIPRSVLLVRFVFHVKVVFNIDLFNLNEQVSPRRKIIHVISPI